jgi:iron-sulfur cluster assembly protein
MLTLTENALDLVRKIPNQPMLPSSAGLRISRSTADHGGLSVKAEEEPRAGDRVVDRNGARVFVGERAVSAVKNKVLDARIDSAGRIQFVLSALA